MEMETIFEILIAATVLNNVSPEAKWSAVLVFDALFQVSLQLGE